MERHGWARRGKAGVALQERRTGSRGGILNNTQEGNVMDNWKVLTEKGEFVLAADNAADAVLRVRIATLGRQRILAVRRAD